jgi:hypothetical protein
MLLLLRLIASRIETSSCKVNGALKNGVENIWLGLGHTTTARLSIPTESATRGYIIKGKHLKEMRIAKHKYFK